MSTRIAFDIVAVEIEKLYQRDANSMTDEQVNDHCQFIAEFIRSCGWDETDYWAEWSRRQDELDKPSGTPYTERHSDEQTN